VSESTWQSCIMSMILQNSFFSNTCHKQLLIITVNHWHCQLRGTCPSVVSPNILQSGITCYSLVVAKWIYFASFCATNSHFSPSRQTVELGQCNLLLVSLDEMPMFLGRLCNLEHNAYNQLMAGLGGNRQRWAMFRNAVTVYSSTQWQVNFVVKFS